MTTWPVLANSTSKAPRRWLSRRLPERTARAQAIPREGRGRRAASPPRPAAVPGRSSRRRARPWRRQRASRRPGPSGRVPRRATRYAIAVAGQVVQERHRRARPATVSKVPWAAAALHLGDHGEQRGDSDAAGDEQVAVGILQWEVVAWPGRDQLVALGQHVVDVRPSHPAGGLAKDRDPPGPAVCRVAAQGVLPRQPAREGRDSTCEPGATCGRRGGRRRRR